MSERADSERELKQQAASLRQSETTPQSQFEAGGRRLWKTLAHVALVVLVVGCVIALLLFPDVRRRLIAGAGEKWLKISGELASADLTAPVFRLPPPPPKPAEPRIIQPAPRIVFKAAEEPTGILYADQTPAAPGKEGEPQAPVSLPKTAESRAAYALLLEKSEAARQLANSGFAEYPFQDWNPVKVAPPAFWIELVAMKADGQKVHFTWSVHTGRSEVRPLSQAARDLEQTAEKR